MSDEDYLCKRCGVNWVGAPGHPKDYCDSEFMKAENVKLKEKYSDLLQSHHSLCGKIEELKKRLRMAQEVINKHVADQVEGLHCVDCVAEDDEICDCPMLVPIFEAMKGYEPPTIEDLLGECQECNRLARDCGNHGPIPTADLKRNDENAGDKLKFPEWGKRKDEPEPCLKIGAFSHDPKTCPHCKQATEEKQNFCDHRWADAEPSVAYSTRMKCRDCGLLRG